MKKILVTCLLLMLVCNSARGQNIPQVFSPTAAELGKYGKIPVSYFNGLPQIEIPLTELRAKDYTLPIYLTYHAGGNKPEQHPGWVGQGWALHAGGCINRIVHGVKDEENISECTYINNIGFSSPRGYLFHASDRQASDWTDDEVLSSVITYPAVLFDYEPDEFMVSIEGVQASFFFTGPNQIQIVSQSDVHFTASYETATAEDERIITLYSVSGENVDIPLFGYIKTICLTTDDGTKYTFGEDLDSIEFSFSYHPEYSYDINGFVCGRGQDGVWGSIANTWNLTSIERPNGEIVSFEYKRDGVPISVVDTHYQYYFMHPDRGLISTSFGQTGYNLNMNYTFLYPSYLKKISSNYGGDEVSFQTSLTQELEYTIDRSVFKSRINYPERIIDSLLQRNHYSKLSSIQTKRGVINLGYTESDTTRLKLLNVTVSDSTGQVKRHSMEYNPLSLPTYNSRKTDSWGYYSRSTSYPLDMETMSQTRRQVNAQLMQAEMLTRLTYPTGGYTTFEYEPHTFSKVAETFPFQLVQETGTAGGLRIKKITDYPSSGTAEPRVFSYESNGASSGILAGYPSFYETGVHSVSLHVGGWSGWVYWHVDDEFDAPYSCFSEHSLIQLPTTRGNNVTYSSVIEERPGGGKTEFVYYNYDESEIVCLDKGPSNVSTTMLSSEDNQIMHAPVCSFELSRGLLKSRRDYDKAGFLVRKEENTYLQDTTQFVKAVSCFNMFEYLKRASYYKHYAWFPALEKKVITEYPDSGGAPFTEEYRYTYDANRNITRALKRVMDYGIDETRIVYSGDTLLGGPASVYAQMRASGILDRPVETLHLRNSRIIDGHLTTYKTAGTLFVPNEEYTSSLSSPADTLHWSYYQGGGVPEQYGYPKRRFRTYDNHGNPALVLDGENGGMQIKWDSAGYRPTALFQGAGPRLDMTRTTGVSFKHLSLRGTTGRCVLTFFNSEAEGTAELELSFDEGESVNCYVKLDTASAYYYHAQNNNNPPGICDNFFYAVQNVPPGRHAFQIALSPDDFLTEIPEMIPLDPVGRRYFQADANISYPVVSYTESITSLPTLYEDFESNGNVTTGGFESVKSQSGVYAVTLSIPTQTPYRIDWMEKSGGTWHYRSESFTGSKFLGSGVAAIDNVRVYPAGAAAKSWTWRPTGELRSETNERGETIRYDYDGLGRLKEVKDKDNNSRTGYEYGYNLPENIIRTKQYTSSEVIPSSQITEQYFDGLGRPSSVVRKAASPLQNSDLTETFEYDTLGRRVRQGLPIPSLQPSFYGAAEEPFSETRYDNSPLDRPVAEYGPGKSWHEAGRAVRTKYLTNNLSDTLKCLKWRVSWTGDTTMVIYKEGYYQPGTLKAVHVADEDRYTVIRFTDMFDNPVLERTLMRGTGNNVSCIDTYYLYDSFGRLAAVLPPELSYSLTTSNRSSWNSGNTLVIDEYAYLYRYNSRGLCIAKKLPGCGWTYMVYDRNERLVFTQNPANRPLKEWIYVFCDDMGRECLRGQVHDRTMDPFADPFVDLPVRAMRDENATNGYAVAGYSNLSQTVHSVTWWDDYRFLGQWGVPGGTDSRVERTAPVSEMTAYGLPTGSKDLVFSTPNGFNYLWSVHYYDGFGREVQANAKYLQGVEKETRTYDFSGNVTAWSLSHMDADGLVIQTESYTYGYDSWGRPTTTVHRLGANGTQVYLSDNSYDAVGRLTSRQRASNTALTESLRYNVRSWLDSISVGTNGSTFSQLMYYNRPHPSGGTTCTWNGNISAIDWRSGSDIGTSSYKYSYDGLSRLKSATHRSAAGFNVFKSWTYDRQGNITAESGNVSYTLAGNQMTAKTIALELAVIEPEPEPLIPEPIGRGDPVITPTDTLQRPIIPFFPVDIIYEYAYDVNGRMVSDTERGIRRITYNQLNLPSKVDFVTDTLPSLYYNYAADGRKLEQGTICVAGSSHFGDTYYNYVPHIAYQGNLVYVDGILDRILIDGGYISAADNVYHFFVTDHLGSIRAVVRADGTVEKCYDYDPYGADLYSNQGTTVPATNPYKFSGKELDQKLSNYDFSARLFGPSTSRWTTMDPLCWKYYSISPYAYCAGNPVNLTDFDGREWESKDGVITVYLNYTNSAGLTEEQIKQYQDAVVSLFNTMIYNASSGKYCGNIVFSKENPAIIQLLDFGRFGDNSIGGNTMYMSSFVNVYNEDGLESLEAVSQSVIHEIFHTVRLDHIFNRTQAKDTELKSIGVNSFITTTSTSSGIISNIMNYRFISINGQYGQNFDSLTPGQLDFVLNEIRLQNQGFGFIGRSKSYKEYEDYWDYDKWPGVPVY